MQLPLCKVTAADWYVIRVIAIVTTVWITALIQKVSDMLHDCD